MAKEARRARLQVLGLLGIGLAGGTLLWAFRDCDLTRVAALLKRVGVAGVLILVPQLLSLFVESVGWRMAFERMGRKLPLAGLFRARLATEALAQTLPMGVVVSESMKPLLLAKSCGAELSTSLAGMAARKWLLAGSQGLCVMAFACWGFPVLTRISASVLGFEGLPYLLMGVAVLLLLLADVSHSLFAQGRVAARLHGLLTKLPWAWLRARLVPLQSRFVATDGRLRAFFATAWTSPGPLFTFLLVWLLEVADTLLILYLLGVQLPWTTVGALEVSVSFLRNVVFMVPAGLGVQDLGYLTFLRALQVPEVLNVAAAFLLLKRSKECFWAIVGYVILALELRPQVMVPGLTSRMPGPEIQPQLP
ncbi:MAG TPA: lysylphosphatidylglycerol synthase domain-containing protein [Polyangiaceae bacterium]|nr:lysylphosphatidylglycerol synthase domain-containing protein [Polyangiaceae bacterium]